MSDAKRFLESVLTWPGSATAPGWINLHVNAKNNEPNKNGGKPWVVGWPYKTVDDLLDRLNWAMSTDAFFNAWVCMSQQSEASTNKAGKPKAVRKAANATLFKAIWIDCDVKPGDANHYHTMQEAFAALTAFRQSAGLPFPSVIVNSGGGLHIYWVSDTPLTLDDWRPYAHGLKALLLNAGVKCDTGLTTDAARILRVPGTLNHKYDPPRPVQLLHNGVPYTFEQTIGFLKHAKLEPTTSQVSVPAKSPVVVIEPGAVFDAPDSAFGGLAPDDALQAGIEPREAFLVDPAPLFSSKGCAFLTNALLTGGKDYDNPQWNLSVLCTAFMENGNAIAHAISKGYAEYDQAETQALYERKVADRADRGIGYPSCAAIAGSGSAVCQGCPHFKKGKSPLNIRPTTAVITATVKGATPKSATAQQLLLPDGYDVDAEGRICFIEEKTNKGGDVVEIWKPLFHNKIIGAYAEKDPDVLHMHISLDKGNWEWVALRLSEVSGAGYEKNLTALKLLYTKHKQEIEAFVMSFMAKLKAASVLQKSLSFGWYRPQGPIEGFAFGGELIHTDGTRTPATLTDPTLRPRYTPTGNAQDWHQAASYIFRQQRADLDCIIASAFAAPLMEFTGVTAAVLASMGEPGSGKSYAMKLAAAVWGKHDETIERKTSTEKGLLLRLGQTGNLPAYWDEISDTKVQNRFLGVQSQIDGGSEGSRATVNIKQQVRGTWCTLAVINGNMSWRDFIIAKQPTHGAGLRRTLEYWVPEKVPNPQGQVNPSEADKALALVMHSFGNVGMEYIEYIVTHLAQVQQIIDNHTQALERRLSPDKKENMWVALCATVLAGAELAACLPTPVDLKVNRLFDFLVNVFLDNRRFMASANLNPVDTAEDFLAQYLKDRFNETIWTMGLTNSMGRAAKVEWRRIQPNANVSHGVSVRWDRVSMTLRFSRTNFFDWCSQKPDNRNPNVIIRALERIYGMKGDRRMLASGTPFKVPQEWVYVIDVSPHQDLREIMDSFIEQTQLNTELGVPTTVGATGTNG